MKTNEEIAQNILFFLRVEGFRIERIAKHAGLSVASFKEALTSPYNGLSHVEKAVAQRINESGNFFRSPFYEEYILNQMASQLLNDRSLADILNGATIPQTLHEKIEIASIELQSTNEKIKNLEKQKEEQQQTLLTLLKQAKTDLTVSKEELK